MILLSGYAKSNKLVQTIVLSIVCAFFVRNCLVMRNNTVLMTINSIKMLILPNFIIYSVIVK